MVKILVIDDEPKSSTSPWQANNVNIPLLLRKIHASFSTNIQNTRDLNILLTLCLNTLSPEEILVLSALELSDIFNSIIEVKTC